MESFNSEGVFIPTDSIVIFKKKIIMFIKELINELMYFKEKYGNIEVVIDAPNFPPPHQREIHSVKHIDRPFRIPSEDIKINEHEVTIISTERIKYIGDQKIIIS